MPYGTIQRWNVERGFGFISDDQDPRKNWAFLHISKLPLDHAPAEGEAFAYDVEPGRDGRATAVNVRPLTPAIEEANRVFGDD